VNRLDLFGERFEIDLPVFQVGEVSAQPIEPPNNQDVAFTQALQAAFKLRSGGVFSAGLLFVYFSALSMFEGVFLGRPQEDRGAYKTPGDTTRETKLAVED
jgi:hypothetical protein